MISRISFTISESGKASLIVDGQDIADKVSVVSIDAAAGELTKVHLTIPAHCAVDVLADVQLSISQFGEEVSREMRRMLFADAAKEDETRL